MDIINKYSQIYGSPFLTGIFIGVNAIKDIALFVDGPDCIFYKADLLYKTHDLFSELKTPTIDTKLYFSGVMPNKMIRGYDNDIRKILLYIEKNPKFNLGIITCMPVTGLLSNQYDSIYQSLDKDFIFIPSYADKFRIDGYSIFLKELAKYLISKGKKVPKNKNSKKLSISIVGYLFDRNEGDCIGNLVEIERLLSLLGVTIDSVWLNGGNLEDLYKIEESTLIISFPYGYEASKILSQKLEIEFLEMEIPFGILNSINFLKNIGEKLGIESQRINGIIKEELSLIKNKVQQLDEKIFLNKNFIYAGDPFLESGIKDIGTFLGMNHIFTYNYNGEKKNYQLNEKKIDLVIGNYEIIDKNSYFYIDSKYKIEFGFPSYTNHFFTNNPYMGFYGVLNFIEKLYNKFIYNKNY